MGCETAEAWLESTEIVVAFICFANMRLTSYIEFDVLIHFEIPRHQSILEKIYRELDEYLIYIPGWYQRQVIVAVFFCANIFTKLILRRLESYNGVNKVESFIRTSITINQNWLKGEIDKRITTNQSYLSSLAATTTEH